MILTATKASIVPSFLVTVAVWTATGPDAFGQSAETVDTGRGDKMIANYFAIETAKLRDSCLSEISSVEQWRAKRSEYRRELLEMLGLDPLPDKSALHPVITGRVEHDDFRVERLQFQSRPGLYVTGNLYVPKQVDAPLPAILYLCGHGQVKQAGVSYGNKVHYQHHGSWFARNGYVCLTIDTLQLGEIEGVHHGTYRYNRWWWLGRGYTPAGVEAWNSVRALDYLESRPEVDAQRMGVTGRSGGGAYSWWVAAIDDRIKCAVPVAGITDLQNHVVDGCVEGHCDCMYMVNTYRWDYAKVAALVAPRPLLISNTDSDSIFPLDGVLRIFHQVRRIYQLHDARDQVGLNIAAGGHQDTQDLQVPAFRWFNRHLQEDNGQIDATVETNFQPAQLKVFDQLPDDQLNTDIDETFVAQETPEVVGSIQQWQRQRDRWRSILRTKSFAGWPSDEQPIETSQVFDVTKDGIRLRGVDFTSQHGIQLRLYLANRADLAEPDLVVLNVLDDLRWPQFLATMRTSFQPQFDGETLPVSNPESFQATKLLLESQDWAMAYVAPRGIGRTAWDQRARKQTQHRRRFNLLGQSLDGMRVWDVRRAIQAIQADQALSPATLRLQSHDRMAGIALYAALFESGIDQLDLYGLPASHRHGPYLLNVTRYLDMPQAVAMVAERSRVVLYQTNPDDWDYVEQTMLVLDRDRSQFQLR